MGKSTAFRRRHRERCPRYGPILIGSVAPDAPVRSADARHVHRPFRGAWRPTASIQRWPCACHRRSAGAASGRHRHCLATIRRTPRSSLERSGGAGHPLRRRHRSIRREPRHSRRARAPGPVLRRWSAQPPDGTRYGASTPRPASAYRVRRCRLASASHVGRMLAANVYREGRAPRLSRLCPQHW